MKITQTFACIICFLTLSLQTSLAHPPDPNNLDTWHLQETDPLVVLWQYPNNRALGCPEIVVKSKRLRDGRYAVILENIKGKLMKNSKDLHDEDFGYFIRNDTRKPTCLLEVDVKFHVIPENDPN